MKKSIKQSTANDEPIVGRLAITSQILNDYILGIPVFKIMVIPIIIFICISTSFEVGIPALQSDISSFIDQSDDNELWNAAYHFMAFQVIHYVFSLVNGLIISYCIQTVYREAYKNYLLEYISTNFMEFHSFGSGKIHSLIHRRTTAVGEFISSIIINLINDGVYLIIAFKEIQNKLNNRAIIALLMLTALLYVLSAMKGTQIRNLLRLKYNNALNVAFNKLFDILQHYEIVKSFNKEQKELDAYDLTLGNVEKRGRIYGQYTDVFIFIQKINLLFPNIIVLYFVIYRPWGFSMRGCDFVLYNGLYVKMKQKLSRIRECAFKLNENYIDIADSKLSTVSSVDLDEGINLEDFHSKIIFKDVGVLIDGNLIFDHLSLEINKGEKVAITGKNGCGKSTFTNVLLRFMKYKGEILIDGQDLSMLSIRSNRDLISYVPQDSHIFNTTVMENLKYDSDSISDELVYELCTKFGTHELFSNLPNGYQSKVGENGKYLSGGQKQKLNFMRAAVKDAPIFILDEPTAALDKGAEIELIDTIFEQLQAKTVFVIVHNLELLRKFDRILYFHNQTAELLDDFENFRILKSLEESANKT